MKITTNNFNSNTWNKISISSVQQKTVVLQLTMYISLTGEANEAN